MLERVALGVEVAGLAAVAIAFWLVAHRRSRLGIVMGLLGVASLAAITSFRALPNPSRGELGKEVVALRDLVAAERKQTEALEKKNGELQKEILKGEQRIALADAAKRKLETTGIELILRAATAKAYSIRRHDDDEWVEGQRGRYYIVRLRHSQTGQYFVFPRGDYRLEPHTDDIREAFEKFRSDVLAAIPMGWATLIMLRGGATIEPMAPGTGQMGAEFGPVRYRPLNPSGRYGSLTSPLPFAAPTTNEHLPLLRAAQYRLLLFGNGQPDAVELLAREPSGNAEDERAVEIVLCIQPA